jgi:hypothetical protein
MRAFPLSLALTLACPACADGTGGAGSAGGAGGVGDTVTLSFQPDQVALGAEDYLCYGFDATALAGRAIEQLTWAAPVGGGVSLHHAIAYAMVETFPDGPLSCGAMPASAVGLHVWAPGDQPLVMPAGFALAIPAATTKIVVQAHVLRLTDAPAAAASLSLALAPSPPAHLAAWHSTFATVPPIPPHGQASVSAGCRARAAVHTLFAWPHMHRLGTRFHGEVQRAAGGAALLVDVPVWDVAHEQTYPVAVDIAAGDVIAITCAWDNPGDTVVSQGPETTDEMCTQGLITWPADAPRCTPL